MKTILLTSLFSILVACGGPEGREIHSSTSSTDNKPIAGDIHPGTFKLYLISRQIPTPNCDVYTVLELANGFSGPVATLSNAVTGPCEIAVDSTPRVFNVNEIAGDCGSRHYAGTGIQITDNRGRLCEDLIEADLITKEVTDSEEERLETTTFFSFDTPRA